MSFAGALSSAAIGAEQPPPWATASDESGRTADARTTASQSPNATSRGAAVRAQPAEVHSAQPAETRTSASQEDARASSAKKSSISARASRSAATGGTAHSDQVADTPGTPVRSATAPASASGDASRYPSDGWGWLGLLGLFGLLGLLRRRRDEWPTDTVASRPDDPARGARVYETPDPVARR